MRRDEKMLEIPLFLRRPENMTDEETARLRAEQELHEWQRENRWLRNVLANLLAALPPSMLEAPTSESVLEARRVADVDPIVATVADNNQPDDTTKITLPRHVTLSVGDRYRLVKICQERE